MNIRMPWETEKEQKAKTQCTKLQRQFQIEIFLSKTRGWYHEAILVFKIIVFAKNES